MNMNGNNLWSYMVNILSGREYEPIVTEASANTLVSSGGVITKHEKFELLSNKLYTPTSLEQFIAK